jgi:hypothetical protein
MIAGQIKELLGEQVKRNYDWDNAEINLLSHTFGIKTVQENSGKHFFLKAQHSLHFKVFMKC